jgi:hypothetical protein
MYEKPKLERFGTFRDLTQFGADGGTDMLTMNGPIGPNCTEGADDPFGCVSRS